MGLDVAAVDDVNAVVESPFAVGDPTLAGRPVVGQTLTCVSGGFINTPTSYTYEWQRNGKVITGATAASYTLTDADLGRTIACRISATNKAGTGDATSETLYVSAGPAAPTPETPFSAPKATTVAPTTTATPATPTTTTTTTTTAKTSGPAFKATCKLAANRRSVACTVSTSSTAKFTATARLSGKSARASKSAKRKLTLTVRSSKAIKKGQKLVLTIKSGKTTKVITAKAR